mmetsp:Transcript_50678/g.101925  ORF Transcript_50678/g.101925 Transcript_50678/m.101925 type:complete len:139 (-) Transcript_50678:1564-1980(-)
MLMNYKEALINGLVIAATLTAAAGENDAVPTIIPPPVWPPQQDDQAPVQGHCGAPIDLSAHKTKQGRKKGAEINQTRIDVKDLCTCLSKGVDIVISADPEKALLNKRDPTSKRTKMFTTISLVFLGACIFRGCFKHRN